MIVKYDDLRKEVTYHKVMQISPNYAELGRKYNLDPRTIKKYFNGYDGKPTTRNKPSKLSEYDEIIKEKLTLPGIKVSAIHFFLKEQYDYQGSYSNLTYHIRKYDDYKKKKSEGVHVRYENEMGEVIQFDWVEDINLINAGGIVFNFNVFSAELCYSRMHYFCYSPSKTREDVFRSLIKSLKFFGGVTEKVLTDNMSSIVNTNTSEFTKEFKAFAKDMGVIPTKCKVRHAYTKGKVEVRNKFMKWLIPYNHTFTTEEEIIGIIEKINIEVNNRINSTTNMKPILLYDKEKGHLKPLPSREIMEHYLDYTIAVKVHNTSLFSYKDIDYSVPAKYINKTLKVKESDNKLYVYDTTDLVVIHTISTNKINYLKEHYIEGLKKSMPNKSNEDIEELAKKNLELFASLQK